MINKNLVNWIFLKRGHIGSVMWEKNLQTAVLDNIYLGSNTTLIHSSLCVFDKWGKN